MKDSRPDRKTGTQNPTPLPSVLWIVATPIGTLGDLSPRAQDILRQVDWVVCEDTRHSGLFFSQLGIPAPRLASLHKENENTPRVSALLDQLEQAPGRQMALISDAGTPAISDPGARLVALAHERGVRVCNVPGPSSLACALASHGFLQPRTIFEGFLPRKPADQQACFRRWLALAPCVAIFFESPHRSLQSLDALEESFGPHLSVCLSREISKRHETHVRGSLSDVRLSLSQGAIRGECVISVQLDDVAARQAPLLPLSVGSQTHSQSRRHAVKKLAEDWGVSSKDLYAYLVQLKGQTEQAPLKEEDTES